MMFIRTMLIGGPAHLKQMDLPIPLPPTVRIPNVPALPLKPADYFVQYVQVVGHLIGSVVYDDAAERCNCQLPMVLYMFSEYIGQNPSVDPIKFNFEM